MIKAIIFDMGGVVLKTRGIEDEGGYIAKNLKVDVRSFIKVEEKYEHDAQRGRLTMSEFLGRIAKDLGIRKYLLSRVWKGMCSRIFIPYRDVLKDIDKIKDNGYRVALITNTVPYDSSYLRKKGIYDQFEHVILSHKTGYRKPEKEIYQMMLKKLGVKGNECIYIDDREENLPTAEKLGMKTIHFRSPRQFYRAFRRMLT